MKTLLQFRAESNSYGMYWFPRNDNAKNLLKKKRKTFDNDDLLKFLSDGYEVQINLGYAYGEPVYVEIKSIPSNLVDDDEERNDFRSSHINTNK